MYVRETENRTPSCLPLQAKRDIRLEINHWSLTLTPMQFELPGQRLAFSLQYDATAELQATASYFITCQSVQTLDNPSRPE